MLVFTDFRYKGVGGVPQVELCALLGLNQKGLKAKVYCYKDSFLYKRLTELGVDYIFIDRNKVPTLKLKNYLQKEDIIVITHIDNSWLLENLKGLNNKIFFYSLHPKVFFSIMNWEKKILHTDISVKRLIEILICKNGLFFMDGPNVEEIIRHGIDITKDSANYLPIPVLHETGFVRKHHHISDIIRFTYMGRGGELWKIYPVVRLLKELNEIERNFELHIITDRNDKFIKLIQKHIPNNNVKLVFVNGLIGRSVEEYLLKNSDIHISMGISSLDGAKLGIPTIKTDSSDNIFPDNYKFQWQYESNYYSIGGHLHEGDSYSGCTIKEMIDQILDHNNYEEIAQKGIEYIQNNHTINSFTENLIKASNLTEMHVKDYTSTKFHKLHCFCAPFINKIECEYNKFK